MVSNGTPPYPPERQIFPASAWTVGTGGFGGRAATCLGWWLAVAVAPEREEMATAGAVVSGFALLGGRPWNITITGDTEPVAEHGYTIGIKF